MSRFLKYFVIGFEGLTILEMMNTIDQFLGETAAPQNIWVEKTGRIAAVRTHYEQDCGFREGSEALMGRVGSEDLVGSVHN